MSDSPEIINATVEILGLYRNLLGEIRLRERKERLRRDAERKLDFANEEIVSLKGTISDLGQIINNKQTAFDNATRMLTEDVKKHESKWREVLVENQSLHVQIQKLRTHIKMKADKKGYPSKCLSCGKDKGSRAYTCGPCFNNMHQDGIDEEREEWRQLREDWQQGERDFPRFR